MKTPTIEQILKAYESKNYKTYRGRRWDLNIFGIRTEDNTPNVFNDFIGFFCDLDGKIYHKIFEATTDPGTYYLNKPINVKGTAILVPGQYHKVWKLDLHNGKYKALCQRYGSVKVYRDNNKDEILDFNPFAIEQTAIAGINIHRAARYYIPFYIGPFSAGCQVIRKSFDFDELIRAAERQAILWGNVFSYTLFEEKDFA